MTDMELLQSRVNLLEGIIANMMKSDRYTFQKTLQIFDGRNIQLGTGVGTTFGTSATQKIGVYGVTPVVQAGAIASPSGGATVDSQARAAIDALRVAIKNFGVTA